MGLGVGDGAGVGVGVAVGAGWGDWDTAVPDGLDDPSPPQLLVIVSAASANNDAALRCPCLFIDFDPAIIPRDLYRSLGLTIAEKA